MGEKAMKKPGVLSMLFAGGMPNGMTKSKGKHEPMLAEGGEVDDDDGEGPSVSDELVIAAEDIMDSLGGGYFGSSPSDSDSRVEKASKEASKKARAKILAQSLKAFFILCESEPHEEAGSEE